jgi:hypothetical protein
MPVNEGFMNAMRGLIALAHAGPCATNPSGYDRPCLTGAKGSPGGVTISDFTSYRAWIEVLTPVTADVTSAADWTRDFAPGSEFDRAVHEFFSLFSGRDGFRFVLVPNLTGTALIRIEATAGGWALPATLWQDSVFAADAVQ